MNFRMIWRILSFILLVEAVFMLPAMLLCAMQKETVSAVAFLITIGIILAVSSVLWLLSRKAKKGFYSRDGLVCVGLSWIVMSLFGALPFRISGVIPFYIDALFEIASGFSTTGASILNNVEALPKGMLLWRSMSHWLGGMGVLVFLLALVPISGRNDGFTMHLLRAESPGPDVGKLVPRMKQTATILYALYIGLTVLDFIFLIIGKMPVFDAVCIAVGTAGTGGFGVLNDSIASYSPYIQNVCTVFMFLFGVNFTCYYLLLCGKLKNVLKDEELHWYLGIALVSIIVVTLNVRSVYNSWGETIRHSAFQVGTFMSSTGFATTDFDKWPTLSKAIIFSLMFIGASAGSTGGGFKVGRGLLVIKMIRRNVRQVLYPQKIQVVRMNGRVVDEGVLRNTNAYLCTYVVIILASFILISFDSFSTMTNLTAVVSCFNNMGPGLEGIGPTLNYSGYSWFSKLILIFDMLAGRLEIFPILVLFSRSAWKRR
ncbi:MAG: TrkH family potassium uptake protein [Clostridiales bacterium]|nr:TrkH family potassium uptake protein [Clostridiales bacterium]